jgi:Cell division protein CrgA
MARNEPSANKRGARRSATGRVTPAKDRGVAPTPRYTPPIPRDVRVSPGWVPVLMGGLLAMGGLLIILNYLELLPGGASNTYLLIGLACITAGFVAATQWH